MGERLILQPQAIRNLDANLLSTPLLTNLPTELPSAYQMLHYLSSFKAFSVDLVFSSKSHFSVPFHSKLLPKK